MQWCHQWSILPWIVTSQFCTHLINIHCWDWISKKCIIKTLLKFKALKTWVRIIWLGDWASFLPNPNPWGPYHPHYHHLLACIVVGDTKGVQENYCIKPGWHFSVPKLTDSKSGFKRNHFWINCWNIWKNQERRHNRGLKKGVWVWVWGHKIHLWVYKQEGFSANLQNRQC